MKLRQLLFIAALLVCPGISHAVTCSVSNVQPISFGAVDPLSSSGATTSMTFTWTCAKEVTDVLAGINLCFNIGASGQRSGGNTEYVVKRNTCQNVELSAISGRRAQ